MELNGRDGKLRRAICTQLQEPCDAKSEGFKAGYQFISDIGRDRVLRVIELYREKKDLLLQVQDGLGCRSFVLAPSNFKQWRGDGVETAEQLSEQMKMFVKSEKDGARTEDLLYELLLRFGQELTTIVETLEVVDQRVFAIHSRQMLFILDGFEEAMIDPLLEIKPREIIALDSVFADSDELKTNLELQCRDAGIQFTCV